MRSDGIVVQSPGPAHGCPELVKPTLHRDIGLCVLQIFILALVLLPINLPRTQGHGRLTMEPSAMSNETVGSPDEP